MILCEGCGKDINIENFDCKIHPEMHDYVIKTQLLVRALNARAKKLIERRRKKQRRA